MPRPKKRRRIGQIPEAFYFKPQGVPLRGLAELQLTLDEVEAMRLVDLEGKSQEQAAEKMGISRQTVGRILNKVHAKLAEAILLGKAIRVETADIENEDRWVVRCPKCRRNYIIQQKPEQPHCRRCDSEAVELYRGSGVFRGKGEGRRMRHGRGRE